MSGARDARAGERHFFEVPRGYRVEETDERVRVAPLGRRFLRSRAEALARKNPPGLPTYHLRVEKVGFALYEVAAYQNLLVKEV